MTVKPRRRTTRPTNAVRHRKVCLYLAGIGDEIEAVAAKLGMSRSKLLMRAWEIARAEIASDSDLPLGLRQKRG